MLLKKRSKTLLVQYGLVLVLFSPTMNCTGSLTQPKSIIMDREERHGISKSDESQYDSGVEKGELVCPPPFSPHTGKAARGVFTISRAGGRTASVSGLTPRNPNRLCKEIFAWLVVWYGCSTSYGLMTRNILKESYYPWTVATIQMISGLLFQLPLWYLNLHEKPELKWDDVRALIPIAMCQLAVHVGATIATGIDQGLPVAHIIKALEPIVTLWVDWMIRGENISSEVFLGLLPLVAGMILPYWKSSKFSPLSVISTLFVVTCSSIRVVLAHKILKEQTIGKNLDAKNLFAILSIMTSIILIPVALQSDGFGFFDSLKEKTNSNVVNETILNLCLSGYLYYGFNEASYNLMGKVSPTTHAVANLMRRPVLIVVLYLANVFHEVCHFLSVRLIPLSFLVWDQDFRETHSVADVLRRKGSSSWMKRIARPTFDSLVGTLLSAVGCIIYTRELDDDDDNERRCTPRSYGRKSLRWKKQTVKPSMGVPQ